MNEQQLRALAWALLKLKDETDAADYDLFQILETYWENEKRK